MASTIVTKNSSTASAVPVTGDLTQGELAVNVTDKKLYTKDSGGTVVKLVGGLGNQEANAVAITGGSINGTTVGATTASTGAFTTLSASSTTTLSGGTANGVAYLNGSKVVTTGSALTFDGTNLGVGVTPSAWSSFTGLQVGPSGSVSNSGTGTPVSAFSNNAYYNGTSWVYINTAAAAQYQLSTSQHIWRYAASGSGNITWSEAMRLDSSGNLGLGVTPSAWNSTSKAIQVSAFVSVSQQASGAANFGFNFYEDAANTFKYSTTDEACRFSALTTGGFGWFTAPSGTAGNAITFTQAMTLTAAGRLGLGLTSPSTLFEAYGGAAGTSSELTVGNASTAARFGVDTSNEVTVATGQAVPIKFLTSNTERARIDSSGALIIGDTGSTVTTGRLRVLQTSTGGDYIARLQSNAASGVNGLSVYYSGASPNGTDSPFLYCEDSTTLRMSVRSNGGIANFSGNNVNLSDRREKTNFAPAGDYLSKICAIPVQTFNYIDQNMEEDPGLTLGVVAQDVQAVAPELVTESNWGTEDEPKMRLSIYQTDLQYALMKALQELKAEFDAYKANHP